MAKGGKCNFKDFKELKKRIDKLESANFNNFYEIVAKELASRLLAKVIKRTPVGQYPSTTGKVGGTLRRGWTGKKQTNAKNYADSLPINKKGNLYEVEIVNPTEYASYVEYGHRTRGNTKVKGRFVGELSMRETEYYCIQQLDKAFEKAFKKK